jgi:ADP-heptose:LPS heptosyltransferase
MPVDWKNVRRVLLIRLRSIGDTVLATPSLIALKRFAPDVRVDILLEDWVAPVLDDFDYVDNVVIVGKSPGSRLSTALALRRTGYDVVLNLHGGTTATFFAFATGAPHRIGYSHYQYKFLFNHVLSSSADFWGRPVTHSAEQQMAMLGFAGVPVAESIKSRLVESERTARSLEGKFHEKTQRSLNGVEKIALIHPAAAFDSKRWPEGNFAAVADALSAKGFDVVSVAGPGESEVLQRLRSSARGPIATFDSLTLPEITALASRAGLFVGNDSGIAHIAAAVGTPTVVLFGSSNVDHWRPWTDAPNEVVRDHSGDIRRITVARVISAIESVLAQKEKRRDAIPAAVRILRQEN